MGSYAYRGGGGPLSEFHAKRLFYVTRTSLTPYKGRPGQGHPDEAFVNGLVGNRHWTELLSGEVLAELGDDVILVDVDTVAALFPAMASVYLDSQLNLKLPLDRFTEAFRFCLAKRDYCEALTVAFSKIYKEADAHQMIQLMEAMVREFED